MTTKKKTTKAKATKAAKKPKAKVKKRAIPLRTPEPPPVSKILASDAPECYGMKDLQKEYKLISDAHHSINRVDYTLNEEPFDGRGFAEVEADLLKLRGLMKEYFIPEGKDQPLGLLVAFAIRDYLELPDKDQKVPNAERSLQMVFKQEIYSRISELWYPVSLSTHWMNDLVYWADTVICGNYDDIYGKEIPLYTGEGDYDDEEDSEEVTLRVDLSNDHVD